MLNKMNAPFALIAAYQQADKAAQSTYARFTGGHLLSGKSLLRGMQVANVSFNFTFAVAYKTGNF